MSAYSIRLASIEHLRSTLITMFVLCSIHTAHASAQQSDPLGGYVRAALGANLMLKQESLLNERSDAAVREARGLFLPSVTLDTRYSDTQGGLNLGDLVNPAYRALNQLTGSTQFPTNIDGRFPYAQETRLRLVQPVFNASILSNYRINSRLRDVQDARFRVSARQLAMDVQLAYVNHARVARVADVYRASLALVSENLRVTRKLLEHGKVTVDAVHRADAQRLEVEQQLADAEQKRVASAGQLNLLMDRALTAPVELIDDSLLLAPLNVTVEQAIAQAKRGREELQQIDHGIGVAEAQEKLARSSYLPNISLAVDYGVQGQEYRFDRKSDFVMVSLVASWSVFNGLRDVSRAQQASLEVDRAELQLDQAEKQIELQVRTSFNALQVVTTALEAAEARTEAARRGYTLTARRFAEGMASPLELLDARTTLTNAELNRVLTRHDYLARRVELERAAALRNLDNDLTAGR